MLLVVLALALPPTAAPAAPTLRVWAATAQGVVDLVPGGHLSVVIELRSAARIPRATLQHLTPAGLTLESATASTGTIATTPFLTWSGMVSSTQPINLVLVYRVALNARAGDRVLAAQAQVGGVQVKASASIRVCCATVPTARMRVYLPVVRR